MAEKKINLEQEKALLKHLQTSGLDKKLHSRYSKDVLTLMNAGFDLHDYFVNGQFPPDDTLVLSGKLTNLAALDKVSKLENFLKLELHSRGIFGPQFLEATVTLRNRNRG